MNIQSTWSPVYGSEKGSLHPVLYTLSRYHPGKFWNETLVGAFWPMQTNRIRGRIRKKTEAETRWNLTGFRRRLYLHLIPKANQYIYEPLYSCDLNRVKFPSLVFENVFTKLSGHCMVWPWPLTFWHQKLISTSMDVPHIHTCLKFGEIPFIGF